MAFIHEQLLLYAVTDRMGMKQHTFFNKIHQALAGGVTMLQLREKHLRPEEFLQEAMKVKTICRKFHVPLIINDNVEIALKSGADGVHVGNEDQPVAEIRKQVGQKMIIGATAKTPAQAKAAEEAGADYLGVGAIFPSPTKKNAIRITAQELIEISRSVTIPVVAIGGINLDNISALSGCGISGIAVVSALFGAEKPKETAQDLLSQVKALVNPNE